MTATATGAATATAGTEKSLAKVFDAKAGCESKLEQYKREHAYSIAHPEEFWSQKAKEHLDWFRPFDDRCVLQGSLQEGTVRWFAGGKLNMSYNCLDRHVNAGNGDKVAMIFEGDETSQIRRLTYSELLHRVCQIANALRVQGVQKGDVVTVYMPMIPELAMCMLACARIGAVHSVVFAGFSAEALAQRISAARSKVVITADVGKRGGKTIPLKPIVNDAIHKLDLDDVCQHVMVWERFYDPATAESAQVDYKTTPKDVRMDPLVAKMRPYCPPVELDAEDSLFILYTSGSTGQPKGLLHTTGGYALFAKMTAQITFDLQPGDIFACVADCGWITGHTYVVYGPLLNGGTTFLFESTPVYPNEGRYWDMVQRHKITQFYTAPTAIRLLMRYGSAPVEKYDLSSLRILGSVGEPINPEAWRWYYEVVGRSNCTVVDTYWQTETGGHVITNLPGVTPMKPGSCTLPFYGIDTVVLDAQDGHELKLTPAKDGHTAAAAAAAADGDADVEMDTGAGASGQVEGVMAIRKPWPGMARTCLGDHERFLTVYYKPYPGFYFTGDSVMRDKDGYHFIIGRMDDVLNVSGHRIGTAEVESALVNHPAVAQAAVVGRPHEIKGQSICAFCMLKVGYAETIDLLQELRLEVRKEMGAFCSPDMIVVAPSLPMTRSGKIMRRILRKIVCGETDKLGDTSTLADPSIVDTLITKVAERMAAKK